MKIKKCKMCNAYPAHTKDGFCMQCDLERMDVDSAVDHAIVMIIAFIVFCASAVSWLLFF